MITHIYVVGVSCGSLSGGDHKKVHSAKAHMALSFWRAFANSPSIVVLDDLGMPSFFMAFGFKILVDELAPAVPENDPSVNPGTGQSSDGMALFLCGLMQQLLKHPLKNMHCYENNVVVVASCKSMSSLNPILTGPDLFSLKMDVGEALTKYPLVTTCGGRDLK